MNFPDEIIKKSDLIKKIDELTREEMEDLLLNDIEFQESIIKNLSNPKKEVEEEETEEIEGTEHIVIEEVNKFLEMANINQIEVIEPLIEFFKENVIKLYEQKKFKECKSLLSNFNNKMQNPIVKTENSDDDSQNSSFDSPTNFTSNSIYLDFWIGIVTQKEFISNLDLKESDAPKITETPNDYHKEISFLFEVKTLVIKELIKISNCPIVELIENGEIFESEYQFHPLSLFIRAKFLISNFELTKGKEILYFIF